MGSLRQSSFCNGDGKWDAATRVLQRLPCSRLSLPRESRLCYLPITSINKLVVQIQFARANALAAYKAKNMADITAVGFYLVLYDYTAYETDSAFRLLA